MDGMTRAMQRLAAHAHPAFPVTIYYAFKQSETQDNLGTTSTGWETFLEAILRAGFAVVGTWPVRTELVGNLKKMLVPLRRVLFSFAASVSPKPQSYQDVYFFANWTPCYLRRWME